MCQLDSSLVIYFSFPVILRKFGYPPNKCRFRIFGFFKKNRKISQNKKKPKNKRDSGKRSGKKEK